MILKLLGLGKKSEYFLEAEPLTPDEVKGYTAPEAVSPPPTKPAAVSQPAAVEPSSKAVKAVEPKQKKVKAVKVEETAAPSSPAPAPKPEPAIVNFATDYLLSANTPRRRPGPSMNMFKDMAKQVNPRQ